MTFNAIQQFYSEIEFFCDVVPQLPSAPWYLVNLPVLVIFLVTLPIRFLVCYLADLFNINPICLLYNLFPVISIFQPVTEGFYNNGQSCPNCYNKGECVTIPNIYQKYFYNCQDSVFNRAFCLIGAVAFEMLGITVQFLNPLIGAITGKILCISANPNLCYQNSGCGGG